MRLNTVYFALVLVGISALISVSCGGESGSDDNSGGAGSAGSAGSGTSGGKGGGSSGGSSQAGSKAQAGSSSAGATSGGSGSSGGTATAGTTSLGGVGVAGGPDLGGAGAPFGISDCMAGVKDGATCTPAMGQVNACQLDATTYCACSGRNNPTWQCRELGGVGGAGGFGEVTCPATLMNGDGCTGTGLCPGSSRCACAAGTVICL